MTVFAFDPMKKTLLPPLLNSILTISLDEDYIPKSSFIAHCDPSDADLSPEDDGTLLLPAGEDDCNLLS